MTIDWAALLADDDEQRALAKVSSSLEVEQEEWRQEAADSLSELYYETYKAPKRGGARRIDHRPGSDYRRFIESHMKPLAAHGVWEALFPNQASARSAQAIDEALTLLADTKVVDRIYSGDIVTATKLIGNIAKKRAKYLEM